MEGIWRPPEEEEYLGFNVARVMACSSSSAVNGVSCAVICFDNTISGTEEFMPIPLSCCVRNFFELVVFMFRSAGADATAVEYSDILATNESRSVSSTNKQGEKHGKETHKRRQREGGGGWKR
jgi:hypothetical protein